jgi:methyl-accepting chemotaxis protein
MIRRVIKEIKKDMYKHLNVFKENKSKQLNKIKETMQDMTGEFNKNTKILKNIQSEILEKKSSVSQIKNSAESLSSRLDQFEDRISKPEDKTNMLQQSCKEKGKKRNKNLTCRSRMLLKEQIHESWEKKEKR